MEVTDPGALARFCSDLPGWPIGHEEPGTAILAAPESSLYVVFQRADGSVRPVRPPVDGRQRPMMHVDFQVGTSSRRSPMPSRWGRRWRRANAGARPGAPRPPARCTDVRSVPTFLAIPAAALVHGRVCRRSGRTGWAVASTACGTVMLAASCAASVGSASTRHWSTSPASARRLSVTAGFGRLTAPAVRAIRVPASGDAAGGPRDRCDLRRGPHRDLAGTSR